MSKRHLFFLRDPGLLVAEAATETLAVADGEGAKKAPAWVNVMPEPDKDGLIFSRDNRVLHIDSMEKLAKRSNAALKKQKGGGLVDRDHETYGGFFVAGGGPAIAWAEEFEARPGKGMWARTDWLAAGEQHLAARDYRYTSAVVTGGVEAEVDQEEWSVTWHITPETVDGFAITNIPALVTTSMFAERTPEQRRDELLAVLLSKLGVPQDADVPTVREAFIKLTRFTSTSADAEDPAHNLEKPVDPIHGDDPPLKKTDDEEETSDAGEADAEPAAELVPVVPPTPAGPTAEQQLETALKRIAKLEDEAGTAFVESLVHAGKLTPAQRKAALAQAKTSEGLSNLRALYEHAPRIVAGAAAQTSAATSTTDTPHGVDPMAYRLAREGKSISEITTALSQRDKESKTR